MPPDRELHGLVHLGAIGQDDRIIVNRQHHLQTWLRAFPGADGVLAPSCSFFPEDLDGGEMFASGAPTDRVETFERYAQSRVFTYTLSIEGHHINARQVVGHELPSWLVPDLSLGLVLSVADEELAMLEQGGELALRTFPGLRRPHPVYGNVRALIAGDHLVSGLVVMVGRGGEIHLRLTPGARPEARQTGLRDQTVTHGRLGWVAAQMLDELLPSAQPPSVETVPNSRSATSSASMSSAAATWDGDEAPASLPEPPHPAPSLRQPLHQAPLYSAERVLVLMDGQNVLDARPSHISGVEFSRMIHDVVGARILMGVRLHLGVYPEGLSDPTLIASRDWLIRLADRLSYEGLGSIQLHSLERKEEVWVQKGVDVALAVESLELAYRDAYDTLVLISGDQDFVPAVESLHRLGKRVEVVAWQGALSYKMRLLADRVIILDQYPVWHRLRTDEPMTASVQMSPQPPAPRHSEPQLVADGSPRSVPSDEPPALLPTDAPSDETAAAITSAKARRDSEIDVRRKDLFTAYERALAKAATGAEGGAFHSELALALRHELGMRQLNLQTYGFDKMKDLTDELERLGRVSTYLSPQKALMVRLADTPPSAESAPVLEALAEAAAQILEARPEGLSLDGMARRLRTVCSEEWAEGLRLHGRSQLALLRTVEKGGRLRLAAAGSSWRVLPPRAATPLATEGRPAGEAASA